MKRIYQLLVLVSFLPLHLCAQLSEKVGGIAGTGNVTATGGASYSMEIEMPVGKNGVRPQISLAYNSQSGMGVAGMGMNISGLSSITRGTKNLYHDGTLRGIKYDGEDAFFLDGRRLILTSGTEGSDGAVYTPEGDPFTRVISHNTYNHKSDNTWFEVKTKDGTTIQYGWGAGSILQFYNSKQGRFRIATWYINNSTDRLGNNISYTYRNWTNVVYPVSISYGSDNRIDFEYEHIGEYMPSTYLHGTLCTMTKRLKAIVTKTKAMIYRRYELAYDTKSDQSATKFPRLKTVAVSNGAGEKMNSTDLTWNYLQGRNQRVEPTNITLDGYANTGDIENIYMMSADVDGDGRSEIVDVGYMKEPYGTGIAIRSYLSMYKLSKDVSGVLVNKKIRSIPIPLNSGIRYNGQTIKRMLSGTLATDYDGDGCSDIILPYVSTNKNNVGVLSLWMFCLKNASGSTGLDYYDCSPALRNTFDYPRMVYADINGDGRSDMFFQERGRMGDGTYPAGIILSTGGDKPPVQYLNFSYDKMPERVFSGDYNGDGLQDLLVLYEGGYKIYFNNGGTNVANFFTESNTFSGRDVLYDTWRVEQGDFDGDGFLDFLLKDKEGYDYFFVFNKGDGTFRKSVACNMEITDQSTSRDDDKFSMLVYDMDGDGISDVLLTKALYRHHGGLGGYNEFKENFVKWMVTKNEKLEVYQSVTTYDSHDAQGGKAILGDFLGLGNVQLLHFGCDLYSKEYADKDLKMRLYRNYWFTPRSGKMYMAEDGLDRRWAFKYGTLNDGETYHRGSGSHYPIADITPTIHVVREIWHNNGSCFQLGTTYTYGSFKAHLAGKGPLGFASVNTVCGNLLEKTETTIQSWDPTYFIPSQTISKTDKGTFTSSTVNRFSVEHKGKNYFSYISQQTTTDIYDNKTVSTYVYDTTKGTLTSEKTDFGGGMVKQIDYEAYVQKGGQWLPTRINYRQKHADGSQWHTTRKRIAYNDQGLPVSEVENSETPHEITTTKTYKDGNLVAQKITGHDMPAITKYYDYDYTGRFVVKQYQEPASEVISFTYDNWGNVLSETDETQNDNRLTTYYSYDGWGDEIAVLHPDGTRSSKTVAWGKYSEGNMYHMVEKATGKPDVTTWYDNMGRVVETLTTGPGGVAVSSRSTYYGSGVLVNKIETTGKLTTSIKYTYDALDRVTSENHSSGSNATYSYGNRTTTATINGVQYTKTYDAWGNVKNVKDPTATVSYFYSSNGKPERITSNGHTVIMTYDAAGYQTSITDPDAGTTTYTYTADGRMLSKTDARGVTLTNSYDELGRLAKQSSSNKSTVSYSYIKEGYGKLQLQSKGLGNNKESYTYDKYGRIIKKQRNVGYIMIWPFDFGEREDSARLDTSIYASDEPPVVILPDNKYPPILMKLEDELFTRYEYNASGRLCKTIYPDSTVAEYIYDANGFHVSTKVNGSVVSTLQMFDGFKTVTKWGGAGLTHTSSVNERGFLTDLSVSRYTGGNMWSMSFAYDEKKGNMLSRNGMTTRTEYFAYDDLDRLTRITGEQTTDMSYSADGNINFKTGVGRYSYLSGKPHAVEGVDNTDNLIPHDTEKYSYNDWGLVNEIVNDSNRCRIYYGNEEERFRMMIKGRYPNKNRIETIYFDDFEKSIDNGIIRNFCYIGNGILSVSTENNKKLVRRLYYMCTDHQGSVVRIVDSGGNSVFEASYDAWGRQTVTKNEIGFRRGYTGHEMLPEFDLINMNGRVYDPTLSRFLSTDPYVQMPDNSQNFNRYSYCLNNPLKYTDPSGEFFGIDDLAIFGFGMAAGYLFSGAMTGNWGFKSLVSGVLTGASAWLGYNMMGFATGAITSNTFMYGASVGANTLLSSFMPSVPIQFSDHFGISISPTVCLGMAGLSAGMGMSFYYNDDDVSLQAGLGVGSNYTGWNVSGRVGDFSMGFGQTTYDAGTFHGTEISSQRIGTISASYKGATFSISNDLWGDKKDRWRSSAAELTIGRFSFGTYVDTNWGRGKNEDEANPRYDGKDPIIGYNDYDSENIKTGAWVAGKVYSSPFWVGYNDRGTVHRYGFNHPYVQSLTQNFVHKYVSKTPFFLDYSNYHYNVYSSWGRKNNFDMWGY